MADDLKMQRKREAIAALSILEFVEENERGTGRGGGGEGGLREEQRKVASTIS